MRTAAPSALDDPGAGLGGPGDGPSLPAVAESGTWLTRVPAGVVPGGGRDSLFTSRRWMEALTATYGFTIQASLLASGATGPSTAIPYVTFDDLCGRRVISLPFSDYADPFVASEAAWQAIAAPLFAANAPLRLRCLHNEIPARDPRFTKLQHAAWHAADLTRPEADAWAALDASARQNIRRAERSGISIRAGRSIEDLRAFYAMHAHVRKTKYRLFAQPFSFFEALWASFGDDLIVLLAEDGGTPVAAILFLVHGDTLYYKFNASISLALRPNDLLVWRGTGLGRERGLVRLDFGISDLDQPGLVRFKRKFATEEARITELRWQPPGYDDPARARGLALLGRLTQLLTAPDVADATTRAVGDEVYRYFS